MASHSYVSLDKFLSCYY